MEAERHPARVPPARRPTRRADRAAQLRARAAKLEQLDKAEARKQDTRCKIIVGGMVLAAMEEDSAFAATIVALLQSRVTREHDRKAIAHLL